jgi:uncharacterized protein (DUF58 family)
MDTTELLKKVRKIEIKSKGLSAQLFSGEYKSAFKGRGMSFSEVREYQPGDDVRAIDWNVTARTNNAHIKVYEEERELTVMLLVDISASENFGTQKQLKRELIAELVATIAFSAIQNKDKVGVVFFTDKIEKFIPPQKGKGHILLIIRELLNIEPQSKRTNISTAIKYFSSVIKKRATTFLISDFESPTFDDELKIASKKHTFIALNISDQREKELPNIGLIPMLDNETGEQRWIDTSNTNVRQQYAQHAQAQQQKLTTMFKRYGVPCAQLNTLDDYVIPLRNVFKQKA